MVSFYTFKLTHFYTFSFKFIHSTSDSVRCNSIMRNNNYVLHKLLLWQIHLIIFLVLVSENRNTLKPHNGGNPQSVTGQTMILGQTTVWDWETLWETQAAEALN